MTRNGQTTREAGQAAIEALFAIPVMLILMLIGFHLFQITWNSQYVHVRARYQVLRDVDHNACGEGDLSGGRHDANAGATLQASPLWDRSGPHTIRQRATIICNTP